MATFTDPDASSKFIDHIEIGAGGYVDSIQIFYQDGTSTAKHGGDGGTKYIFNLDQGTLISFFSKSSQKYRS